MYETPRKKGRPLTENERNLISHLLRLGHTQTDIAKVIGVYPSTICRELRRGEVELLNSDKWIQNEPILYRAYYTLAITTGLRRGELCALQWRDITGACELTVRRSRSCASGQIVESDTKSHRERIVTIPMGIWELLMALRQQQVLHSGVPDREQPIFTDPDGHVPHPDSFTRHLRKLYKKCGLSEDYHLHTLRHFYATYLLQEGTSKQVAASLLGHADTAFLERTYCHPQDVAKQQAANLMQDLLNNQNPCYVAFMKNRNRKPKKAG